MFKFTIFVEEEKHSIIMDKFYIILKSQGKCEYFQSLLDELYSYPKLMANVSAINSVALYFIVICYI